MKKFILYIFLLVLSACSSQPSQESIQTAIAQTQEAQPKSTLLPTDTITPVPTITNTPLPTDTPTITFTPSLTPTYTPTATPINLSKFTMISIGMADSARNDPGVIKGRYIKALALESKDTSGTFAGSFWISTAEFGARGLYVKLQKGPEADNTISLLTRKRWMWIYAIGTDPKQDFPVLSVAHIDEIPQDQYPRGNGVYTVGKSFAPGRWKSMSDATESTSCYWARIDASGNILANFLGYGGTTVYVRSTDYAVDIRDCSTMIYLGP